MDVRIAVAVMVAALGVFGSASAWPDVVVAGVMEVLALRGARTHFRQARHELRPAEPARI